MEELFDRIRRVTMPLPHPPGHVHCYLLPGDDGWTIVDTGLGLPDAKERWERELRDLDGPVAGIFVTHFHPDHVGAAADLRELTGATVIQGALDFEQCERVWGNPAWGHRLAEWFHVQGVPERVTRELVEEGAAFLPFVRYEPDPVLVEAGETVAGWELVGAPGHSDGQLCLLRDSILVAADHVLDPISPTVGLWPSSRPDPLGDYLASLELVIELAPSVALTGHRATVRDPAGRARELIQHHRKRLDAAEAALGPEPRSGYQLSYPLFGDDLAPVGRRFAVAETLSHLERLVQEGRAERIETDESVAYTAT